MQSLFQWIEHSALGTSVNNSVWAFAAFWYIKTRELEPRRRKGEALLAHGAPDQRAA